MNNDMVRINEGCWLNRFWITKIEKRDDGKADIHYARIGGSMGVGEVSSDLTFEETLKAIRA